MADIQFKEVPVLTYEDLSAQAKMVLSLGTSYPVATRLLGQVALDSVRQWLELNFGIIDYIGKYASLSSAITAIGTEQRKTLLINEPIEITSTTIVPDNITLWILDGCAINVNAPTLTMRVPICGDYQIFEGLGAVRFSGPVREVLPVWFGATGDGETIDTDAIQKALDTAYYIGGVPVKLSSGTFLIDSPLYIYSGTWLVGASIDATIVKLDAASNCAVIKSGGDPALRSTTDPYDFDSLELTNTWDDIPVGIGLKDLCIDGDRNNQTSSHGVQLYGKRLYAHNIAIVNCGGDGWRSKAGTGTGQTTYKEMPEADLNKILIKNCTGTCLNFEGPHDSYLKDIGVASRYSECGVSITGAGNCYIGMIHQYTCDGDVGFYVGPGVTIRADKIIAESNKGIGFRFRGVDSQIQTIEAYKNCTELKLLDLVDTSAYRWTQSGSGTNEYWVGLVEDAGDPSLMMPCANWVYINDSIATKGTLGSLSAGEWGYGDNDSNGFSTIYVRLSDGTDPDTKATGYVQVANRNISVLIEGNNSQFGNIITRLFDSSVVQEQIACRVVGYGHTINALKVKATEDNSQCKVGLDIDSILGRNIVSAGEIVGCEGGTVGDYSIGLRTGLTSPALKTQLNLTIQGCDINWQNVRAGERNIYNIQSGGGSLVETMFSGVGPDSTNKSEIWNYVQKNSSNVYSRSLQRVMSSNIDMTSTVVASINIPHGLITTPNLWDLQISFVGASVGDTYKWDIPPYIVSVDATNVVVRYKLSSGGSNTGNIVLWARL